MPHEALRVLLMWAGPGEAPGSQADPNGVASFNASMRIYVNMRDLEQVFKGLADQNRLRILNLLLHGELCVCDIQYVLASSQPNVSRHLTYLKNAGLVRDRREGTRIYYRLAGVTERVHKPLFAFLRDTFRGSEQLQEDVRELKKAIQRGSCTVSEWRPFSALTAPGAATPHR